MAYRYCEWIWMAVGLVWLLGAFRLKPADRREGAGSLLFHRGVTVAAYLLLFYYRLGVGPLAWRYLPGWPGIAWAGLAITAAGGAFAVWARLLLGGNWSASVTVKQDHRLIRRGPYRIVRHPIYTGLLTSMLGTALALGEIRGLIGFAIASLGWTIKSGVEESFMIAQFGDEYRQYRREVRRLIPFVL